MDEEFEMVADKYGRLGLVLKSKKIETKNIKNIKDVEVKKPTIKRFNLKKKK